MDERSALKEAKATLENIKEVQESLEQYTHRLDKIVLDLETSLYGDKQLTQNDMKVLNDIIIEDDEDLYVKSKKRRGFQIFFFSLSFLSLLISGLAYYLSESEFIHFNKNTYYIYQHQNLDPFIKTNSILQMKAVEEINLDDFVLYRTRHDLIKIKQFKKVEDKVYFLSSPGQIVNSHEEVAADKLVGAVASSNHKIGTYLVFLIKSKYLIYLLTIALFIIGFLVS